MFGDPATATPGFGAARREAGAAVGCRSPHRVLA
jgi:hypothetical protein